MDHQTSALSKELSRLEQATRLLRSEVAGLEISRHAEDMRAAAADHRRNAATAAAASPMATGSFFVAHPAAAAAGGRYDPNHSVILPGTTNTLAHHPVVQPFYDEWVSKVAESKQALRELEMATASRGTNEAERARLQSEHEVYVAEWNRLHAVAKWKPGSESTRECPIELRDEHSKLKRKLVDLYEDRSTRQRELERQVEHMKDLQLKIDENAILEQEQMELRTEVTVLQQQSRSMSDEIEGLERLLRRKDKLFDSSNRRTAAENAQVRDLEAVKRVTQSKLQSHKEQIRIHDTAIRHRAAVISRLSERLENIGCALAGDDTSVASSSSPTENRVELEVVEAVRREADTLAREKAANTVRLQTIDHDIADLHGRIVTLQKAAMVTENDERRRRRDHERNMSILQRQLLAQQDEVANYLRELQREVEVLRREKSQRGASRSPTPGESPRSTSR